MNVLRILVMLVLGVGLWATPAMAQSRVSSYISVASGLEVRASEPWFVDLDATNSDANGESIVLSTGIHGLVLAYLPSGGDLVAVRDMFLDQVLGQFSGQETIDRGAYGAVSYSLDVATVEGVRMGMFTLFLGQRASGFDEAYFYTAPTILFGDGLASLQEHVTVGGTGVFAGVDGDALQDLLNAADPGGGFVATPVGQDLSSLIELGYVQEGRYISPQYGVEVTWGPEWVLDTLAGTPIESSDGPRQDTLLLDRTGGGLELAGVFIREGGDDDWETWLSTEVLGMEGKVDVLTTRSEDDAFAAILLGRDSSDPDLAMVLEVACTDPSCGTIVGALVMGIPDSLAVAYADARGSIAIDGVPAFSIFQPEEVQAALGQIQGGQKTGS